MSVSHGGRLLLGGGSSPYRAITKEVCSGGQLRGTFEGEAGVFLGSRCGYHNPNGGRWGVHRSNTESRALLQLRKQTRVPCRPSWLLLAAEKQVGPQKKFVKKWGETPKTRLLRSFSYRILLAKIESYSLKVQPKTRQLCLSSLQLDKYCGNDPGHLISQRGKFGVTNTSSSSSSQLYY